MERVLINDARYPRLLKEVIKGPPFLYIQGDVEVLNQRLVAVVGSREVSEKGVVKTREIVEELVRMGKVIVSGLARGTDRVAHEAALDCGGKTIAVLAHGLDMVYPREHEKLARRILENGGALISEHEVGTKPQAWYFLARNRVMVGMSEALIVVEAEIKSGSMASANFAAELGRELLVVPGTPGTDLLIEDGATKLE